MRIESEKLKSKKYAYSHYDTHVIETLYLPATRFQNDRGIHSSEQSMSNGKCHTKGWTVP